MKRPDAPPCNAFAASLAPLQFFTPPTDNSIEIVVCASLHLEYLMQLDAAPASNITPQIVREIRTVGGAGLAASALAQWNLQVLARLPFADESDANARFARRTLQHPNLKTEASAQLLAEQAYRVQIFAPQTPTLQMQRGHITDDVTFYARQSREWNCVAKLSNDEIHFSHFAPHLQVLADTTQDALCSVGLRTIGVAAMVKALHEGWPHQRVSSAARVTTQMLLQKRQHGAEFHLVPCWNAIENAVSKAHD